MEIDRFNRYEENFLNSSRIISRCISQLESSRGVVDTIIACSVDIEGELSEAEGYLRAMDIEFRTMSSIEKKSAQSKINDYRDEVRQLTNSYNNAKSNAEALAIKNLPAARQKLLVNNSKLDNSTATLEKSRQLLNQTQQVGNEVLQDLENQKEKLVDSKSHVKDTKNLTTEARRVLKLMGQRAILHKICVAFTILFLLGAIIGVGYYGVVKK